MACGSFPGATEILQSDLFSDELPKGSHIKFDPTAIPIL